MGFWAGLWRVLNGSPRTTVQVKGADWGEADWDAVRAAARQAGGHMFRRYGDGAINREYWKCSGGVLVLEAVTGEAITVSGPAELARRLADASTTPAQG